MGAVRTPLRRHRGCGSPGRSGARRPIRLPARNAVAGDRRGGGRRGAGLRHSLLLAAPGRQVARANGEGGSEPGGRGDGDAGRAVHHDHPARRAGVDRGERPQSIALGPVHHRVHYSHRAAHGVVDEAVAAGKRGRGIGGGGRPAAGRARRGGLGGGPAPPCAAVHPQRHRAHVDDDGVRVHCLGPARMDALVPARLPLDVPEDHHHPGARDRYPGDPPAAPHAGAHAVRVARGGPGVRGKTLSIRVHHNRVRGDLGIPLARGVRHHAQDDRARVRRPADRLRRHADGVVRGRDGDDPGVYFAMNTTPAALAQASQVLGQAGFVVTPDFMRELAARMGETTLLARSGGAPSLAVGIAQIFAGATSVLGGKTLDALWYHFAIMFEALFILTTIDTGTRVGRFMLQEIVGHVWPRFAETSWYPSVIASSALVVAGWGYFLYQGVVDPLGGINSLWPLFGISNQLLAAVALCVGTTILIKMGRGRFAWVTAAPLAWLVTVTMTAGWQKVFSADPRLGFLSHAASLAGSANPDAARLIFNDRLNTFVALLFMTIVTVLIVTSLREWWLVLSRRKTAVVHEAPYVETGYATGD